MAGPHHAEGLKNNRPTITASNFGQFIYLHECELYLLRASTKEHGRLTGRRVLEKGGLWERRINCHLRLNNVMITDCTHLDAIQQVRAIISNNPGNHQLYYLYQPSFDFPSHLIPPPLGQAGIAIGSLRPDFLRLHRRSRDQPGNIWRVSIIDAKSSATIHASHQAQVAFYAYFLRFLFSSEFNASLYEWDDDGWIWLDKPHWDIPESLESFLLEPWVQVVEDKLHHQIITSTFSQDIEDVPWHLRPSCQGCGFLDDCREKGKTRIEGLPYISREDLQFLLQAYGELCHQRNAVSGRISTTTTTTRPVRPTLTSLYDILDPFNTRLHQRLCHILGSPSSPSQLPPLLETMMNGQARLTYRPYGLFPFSSDDVAMGLVIGEDEANGLPYGWSLVVQVKAELGDLIALLRSAMTTGSAAGVQQSKGYVILFANDGADFAGGDDAALREREMACCMSMLGQLSKIIRVLVRHPELKSQMYVWESSTWAALTKAFTVYAQNTNGDSTHVHQLALALLDVHGLWQLTDLPSIAIAAQFRSSSDITRMNVKQLEREGDLSPGTARARGKKKEVTSHVKDKVRRLNQDLMTTVPFICELVPACRALLYLPQPGFYTASGVISWAFRDLSLTQQLHNLNLSEQESVQEMELCDIQGIWMEQGWVKAKDLLQARALGLLVTKDLLRRLVLEGGAGDRLFNDSGRLACIGVKPQLTDPLLQRLAFMKQADVISRCQEARDSRMKRCNRDDLIQLEYYRGKPPKVMKDWRGKIIYCYWFVQVSGPPLFPDSALNTYSSFPYILSSSITAAQEYLDLVHVSETESEATKGMTFATIRSIIYEPGHPVILLLQLSPSPQKITAEDGEVRWEPVDLFPHNTPARFWLFERVVDKNLPKIISALQEFESDEFRALLTNPHKWAHPHGDLPLAGIGLGELQASVEMVNGHYYNETRAHDGQDARLQPLGGEQKKAFDRLVSSRLTLVWGPPGTGKTFFAARALLTIMEAISQRRGSINGGEVPRPLRILVTAFTHTAINNVLLRVAGLRDLMMTSFPSARQALSGLKVVKLVSDGTPEDMFEGTGVEVAKQSAPLMEDPSPIIVGATIWRLYKDLRRSKSQVVKQSFDIVVIDEASQLAVADSLIPICCLKPHSGRLLVLGDAMQLAPIMAQHFPRPRPPTPNVQSSILECLTRDASNGPVDLQALVRGQDSWPTALIKLNDNYRMNVELSAFTARLYGQDYAPPQGAAHRKAGWEVDLTKLPTPTTASSSAVREAVKHIRSLADPITGALPSLISICVQLCHANGPCMTPEEVMLTSIADHAQAEAAFVSELMRILSVSSRSHANQSDAAGAMFACTPHRRQKAAIQEALGVEDHWQGGVDTVERVQGQERPLVMLCLGFFSIGQLARERDFIFSKRRVNVAISRAQQCAILIHTQAVLDLNPEILGQPDANVAYSHLKAFVETSRRIDACIHLARPVARKALPAEGHPFIASPLRPRPAPKASSTSTSGLVGTAAMPHTRHSTKVAGIAPSGTASLRKKPQHRFVDDTEWVDSRFHNDVDTTCCRVPQDEDAMDDDDDDSDDEGSEASDDSFYDAIEVLEKDVMRMRLDGDATSHHQTAHLGSPPSPLPQPSLGAATPLLHHQERSGSAASGPSQATSSPWNPNNSISSHQPETVKAGAQWNGIQEDEQEWIDPRFYHDGDQHHIVETINSTATRDGLYGDQKVWIDPRFHHGHDNDEFQLVDGEDQNRNRGSHQADGGCQIT